MFYLSCTGKLIAKNEVSTHYIVRFDCIIRKCADMYMLFKAHCVRTHSCSNMSQYKQIRFTSNEASFYLRGTRVKSISPLVQTII